MGETNLLTMQFEQHRDHLRAIAYRMLGSFTEADDAVQETWIRLSRYNGEINNLVGFLTTVIGRVCLDMLRLRVTRGEEPLDARVTEPAAVSAGHGNPEYDAVLGDSVGLALKVVVDTLAPAERVAFVLHDMFAVPFDEIAPIVSRSPSATRQLASRARRRVQDASPNPDTDLIHQRKAVSAFLTAARGGNFDALLAMLDPDVTLHADDNAVAFGAPRELLGRKLVAQQASGRAEGARLALVGGGIGAAWSRRGKVAGVFTFTVVADRITRIDMSADPDQLRHLDVVSLED